jgi:cysteine synthase
VSAEIRPGVFGAVGDTPLIRLKLSDSIGREVLGKAEFLNPSGSVKDRAAKYIILDGERSGRLKAGGTIVEGTAGNTGIALALLGNARGYRSIVVVPDDQSAEKIDLLRALGADVRVVASVPFADERNYYHVARGLAESLTGAMWADQFNNEANWRGHFASTGQEIWQQTDGRIDAFTCACGTGGTFAGVSAALKEHRASIRTIVADPMGSSLYSFVKRGVLEATGDSVSEGIGIKRLTENFKHAVADDAIQVDDRAMIEMVHYLVRSEGLMLGGSAALNVVAAARVAMTLPQGSTIVTILCDGGTRYLSRLFNPGWLAENALTPRAADLAFLENRSDHAGQSATT